MWQIKLKKEIPFLGFFHYILKYALISNALQGSSDWKSEQ